MNNITRKSNVKIEVLNNIGSHKLIKQLAEVVTKKIVKKMSKPETQN